MTEMFNYVFGWKTSSDMESLRQKQNGNQLVEFQFRKSLDHCFIEKQMDTILGVVAPIDQLVIGKPFLLSKCVRTCSKYLLWPNTSGWIHAHG